MALTIRFLHLRTFTASSGDPDDRVMRAMPACLPDSRPPAIARKTLSYQTTTDAAKVTCPQCKIRMGTLKAPNL